MQQIFPVRFDEPLDRHTTIRVGGQADAYITPQSVEELEHVVKFARSRRQPLFILGAGSNLLVRDKGIRGLVLSLSHGFSRVSVESQGEGQAVLFAEAGVGIPRLVDFAAEQGLTGLEPLAGIPGNVGGGLVMNAGTPDGEISDHLLAVTLMEPDGHLRTLECEKLRFEYRKSHFPRGSILLSARFGLKVETPEAVKGRIRAERERRVKHQPLNVPNLGSVFKNPGKRAAGALIEEAGLKGVRVGQARISEKHANFIVNEGGATAKDILVLIGLIRDKVREKFKINLEPEVRVVGEE